MSDRLFIIPYNWMDWLAVFGYLAFMIFIAWRVLNTKSKSGTGD